MNIPEQLYYKLEEDGCWHELTAIGPDGLKWCKLCEAGRPITDIQWPRKDNPNLSDPDWDDFGWMIERAKEKDWWSSFLSSIKIKIPLGKSSDMSFDVVVAVMTKLTSPTALCDALVEYFGLEE